VSDDQLELPLFADPPPPADQLRLSQEDVLSVLREALGGRATDADLLDSYLAWARLSAVRWQSPSGVRTRRNELVRRGLVVDTGERRRLASGRSAVIWAVVE
jgi:hypothetical protein